MPKFATVAILAVLVSVCQGFPTQGYDIASAAAEGNWDEVHNRIAKMYNDRYGLLLPIGTDHIKNYKPPKGGKFYGEAEYTFHSAATDGSGRTHEQSGGHKVINDNGKLYEFNFKPPSPVQPKF